MCCAVAKDKVSYKRQRFVAVFDREGFFISKIDRMLYGFYYFTSCPVGLLCLNWRGSAAARVTGTSVAWASR